MNSANHTLPAAQQSAAPSAEQAAPQRSWWSLVREDARCVLERDPAARSLLEVWTIYPGVQAIALHRLAHALWQRGWRYGPRWISFLSRWLTTVDIHPGARIGNRFFIDHGAGVVIGETAEIGHDVTIYHGVTLGGTTWSAGKRHPTLGNHVVVGAGAKILGPIVVGNRARIAANSVVIEEVPAGATVVGIPGRVVAPRRATTHGFDLDHHLIPDPVGKAISCLLDRVAQLERQLQTQLQAHTQVQNQAQVQAQSQTQNQASAPVLSTPGTACGACNDHCAEPGFDPSLLQPSTPE